MLLMKLGLALKKFKTAFQMFKKKEERKWHRYMLEADFKQTSFFSPHIGT